MSTEALIEQLLDGADGPSSSVIDALHELLDDRTIDTEEPPRGVSDAAAIVGLSTHTLRYYEQLGLLRPARNASGHREYSAADLRRLIFLIRMRLSGMAMQDLTHYIQLVEAGQNTVAERRQMMIDQRERIERQLRELTLALEATNYKIATYGGHPTG